MSDLNSMACGCHEWKNRLVNNVYHHLAEADAPLAMGYIPYQQWNTTFELSRALQAGTIFPDLDKPFCGRGGAWK